MIVPGEPWGICIPCANCAAVGMGGGEKAVQYITLADDTLTLGPSVGVGGGITGIGAINDNLAVTHYHPPAVEIISAEGEVLHRLDNKTLDRLLFRSPWYLTVAPYQSSIFVSDFSMNTVTMLDQRLEVLKTFRAPSLLESPLGIKPLNDIQVLIACGAQGERIVHLNHSSGKMKAILGKEDGLERPKALAFCPDTRTLYVSPVTYCRSIQRYKLH